MRPRLALAALAPVVFVLAAACSTPAATPAAADVDAVVARVMSGLRPGIVVKGAAPITYPLAERMAHYKVPGVSIAVADSGRIVWARSFGVKEAGTTDSVTPTTIFQAASISKPVAATGMMRLVQEGKLSLDAPVNDYLTSWKLPDNRFTATEKVTLRRIASHHAGLTVHGFPGYAVTDSIPTVVQVLDGAKPANTKAVRVDTTPGAIVRYSGGGTTMEQLVMTDVSGEPFPALMKRLVLDPMGMTESGYDQPLPPARRGQEAAGHRSDGTMVEGRWHVYPEMAPAGLWTTPTDLLKWALEIAAGARRDIEHGVVAAVGDRDADPAERWIWRGAGRRRHGTRRTIRPWRGERGIPRATDVLPDVRQGSGSDDQQRRGIGAGPGDPARPRGRVPVGRIRPARGHDDRDGLGRARCIRRALYDDVADEGRGDRRTRRIDAVCARTAVHPAHGGGLPGAAQGALAGVRDGADVRHECEWTGGPSDARRDDVAAGGEVEVIPPIIDGLRSARTTTWTSATHAERAVVSCSRSRAYVETTEMLRHFDAWDGRCVWYGNASFHKDPR
ncbi:MAG: beta-lactamase family protein [Gemmatimonadetes bacterium]|nr:beta-lactamase family protein [Gemmatimonadota bacterium]